MLYVGLDLSRKRLDFDALLPDGQRFARGAVPPDADGLAGLVRRLGDANESVLATIESMSGARFVHELLARLALPEPWQQTTAASLELIDFLDEQIAAIERELRTAGADHRYIPL